MLQWIRVAFVLSLGATVACSASETPDAPGRGTPHGDASIGTAQDGGAGAPDTSFESFEAPDATVETFDGAFVDASSCHVECPAIQPEGGTACASVLNLIALVCQYPSEAGAGCVNTSQCAPSPGQVPPLGATGTYYLSGQFENFYDTCQSGAGVPPAACPPTLDEVPVGQACASGTANVQCAYPWSVCDCSGAPADSGGNSTWYCLTVDSTCPPLPPLLGTACTATASCAYGRNQCVDREFGFYACRCGAWLELPVPPCAPPI